MMLLLREDLLGAAIKEYPDLRGWLITWTRVTKEAAWTRLNDVRKDYPSADGVKLRSQRVLTVFNAKGNAYRLLTNVDYAGQVVQVLELLTHAEYDKEQWKQRY